MAGREDRTAQSVLVTPENVKLVYQQFYARQSIPQLPKGVTFSFDVLESLLGDLNMMLIGYCMAEEIPGVFEDTRHCVEATFPRWLPKWLQRRWTHEFDITLTCKLK